MSFARSLVLSCFAFIVTYQSTIALPATAQSASAATGERSRDTHVIDQVPIFDIPEDEAPTRTVEKAAQRQIEDSLNEGCHR